MAVVGTVEGADETVLDALAGAARTEDGGGVAALSRSARARRCDSNGELRRSAGRRGEGPGEYECPRIPTGCVGTKDVPAHDGFHRRVAALDLEDGSLVDVWPLPREAGFEMACAPDGRLVGGGGEASTEAGPYRPLQTLHVWRGGDPAPRTLRERVPGVERWMTLENGGGSRPGPWGRQTRFAASSDGVWLSTGDAHEVASRLEGDDDSARIQEFEEEWRDVWGDPLPETFPSVGGMMTPRTGEGVWIQHFVRPTDVGATWVRLDDWGAWKRVLRSPERMRLMDVGADWGLVRVRDDLDRDVLHVYALVEET